METRFHRDLAWHKEVTGLGIVLLLAIGLRIYRIDSWGLEGDELNTLRDSLTASWLAGPKPLLFFLNHHLIGNWTVLDERSLRILPTVFGVASVAAVYGFVRRTIDTPTAFFAALFVAIHPGQVYWSQYARYYSLAYLLTTLATFAAFLAVSTTALRWFAAALLAFFLAWLAHPSTALVAVAVVAWAVGQLLTHDGPKDFILRGVSRWQALFWIVMALVAATLFWLPMLLSWHQLDQKWGYGWIHVLLGHIEAVSPALFLGGLVGTVCLWTNGQRPIASLLAAVAIIPLLLSLLLSSWVSVTQGYLFASTFVFPIGTAYLIDRLAFGRGTSALQRLAAAMVFLFLLLEQAPRLWSHYCDGSRPDFRSASQFIGARAGESDHVLADQPKAVKHYLSNLPVTGLRRDSTAIAEFWRSYQTEHPLARLWIVAEFRRRGGFNDQDLGPLSNWLNANGRLVASFSHSRLDFRFDEVRVYEISGTSAGRDWEASDQ